MTQSKLNVRHNEKGSLSVSPLDGHLTLRLIHQSQFGDIHSETEIHLEPNQVLHVVAVPQPEPEQGPGVIEIDQAEYSGYTPQVIR